MTRFLTSDVLTLDGVHHGFFTREAWAPEKLDAKALVTCRQIHSATVAIVKTPWPENDARPEADALVTTAPGIALGIRTADCAPVLFADSSARVIGAAHAGWRGALSGVLAATIDAMETLGAKRENVRAAVGPCLGAESYEVGPEFLEPFLMENGKNAVFFSTSARTGRALFDLGGYVLNALNRAGVRTTSLCRIDTFQDARFYSHRKGCQEGRTEKGRQISAIALDERDPIFLHIREGSPPPCAKP